MARKIRLLLHNVTHSHMFLGRPDGPQPGRFVVCNLRLSNRCHVWFCPALPGAAWHRVPPSDDEALLTGMMATDTAEQAMALLRAATQDNG